MQIFPTPPTDNLYKFVAVGGLLLFGAGFALVYLLERDRQEVIFRRVQAERAETERHAVEALRLYRQSPATDPAQHDRETAAILGAIQGLKDASDRDLIDELTARTDLVVLGMKGLIATSVLGLVAALTGFGLWWHRFQRHQDRAVRAEAGLAELRLKEAQGGTATATAKPKVAA